MKPGEDANRDVETSLYPRESCNATDDNWRDWWCAPGQFVPTPCLQFSPSTWNAPTQLRDEVMHASQSVFSLRKAIQLPTTLLRTMKVPHPSPMLCRARFYQIRPKCERNSTLFVDDVPRYQCQLPKSVKLPFFCRSVRLASDFLFICDCDIVKEHQRGWRETPHSQRKRRNQSRAHER